MEYTELQIPESKIQLSMTDLIIESHIDLERQKPGSVEMTLKALSFIDDVNILRTADLGCGTGGQTLTLAQKLRGEIIGVDQFPQFVNVLNNNAKNQNLDSRVKGIVASLENLPFETEWFDLIWSEGAMDEIGFECGLNHWKRFLKKGGYIAVTNSSWFTNEHPAEVEKFWAAAETKLHSVERNISIMKKHGYSYVSSFILPEDCWTEQYYIPRETAEKAMLRKYGEIKMLEEFVSLDRYEAELYSKYKQYFGYVFYIGRKM
jgi:ubiquinone/menaquinone biosynthesis C-methylase UbiE